MAHQRQLIREAAKAALVAANTAAGSRVYETRTVPFRKIDLPALAVYTLEETIDPASRNTAPLELTRNLKLMIEGAAQPGHNVDDTLDDLAVQVERAMHADDTLGGVCGWSLLESSEIDIFEDGDKTIGLLRLIYAVTYYTYAPDAADVTLDSLNTVTVDYDANGQTTPAEDKVTF